MKATRLAVGLAAVLLVPAAVHADYAGKVKINSKSGYEQSTATGIGTGGTFEATITADGGGVIGSPFLTFCLELDEVLSLGAEYNYSIESSAIGGGVLPTSPDPVSVQTAYLYKQFLGLTQAQQKTQGDAYQTAIWVLEQEITDVSKASDSAAAQALINAVNALALSGTAADYGVVALNLYSGSEPYVQSVLGVVVPEPTTVLAGALLLLPFGLSAVRVLRRKQQVG
jgi:hypothetical protein